jgi:sugar lactone lactonase YvrE
MAFDRGGSLYATDYLTGEVDRFAPGAKTGATYGDSLNVLFSPTRLAFDAKGDLFVADTDLTSGSNPGGIEKFDPTGKDLGVFASGLSRPHGLAFDALGNLFVADGGAGTVLEFDPRGTLLNTLAVSGDPVDLAFGPPPPAVPEASTTVSLGLLLALGTGGVVIASKRKKSVTK